MTVLWIILGVSLAGFLLLLTYALCKVSSDADRRAGYSEEYARDLDEPQDDKRI